MTNITLNKLGKKEMNYLDLSLKFTSRKTPFARLMYKQLGNYLIFLQLLKML
tara:strand:+ start:340 stop:495 length:156 start_codon:yes stop_codon:yes gene_type:complete